MFGVLFSSETFHISQRSSLRQSSCPFAVQSQEIRGSFVGGLRFTNESYMVTHVTKQQSPVEKHPYRHNGRHRFCLVTWEKFSSQRDILTSQKPQPDPTWCHPGDAEDVGLRGLCAMLRHFATQVFHGLGC